MWQRSSGRFSMTTSSSSCPSNPVQSATLVNQQQTQTSMPAELAIQHCKKKRPTKACSANHTVRVNWFRPLRRRPHHHALAPSHSCILQPAIRSSSPLRPADWIGLVVWSGCVLWMKLHQLNYQTNIDSWNFVYMLTCIWCDVCCLNFVPPAATLHQSSHYTILASALLLPIIVEQQQGQPPWDHIIIVGYIRAFHLTPLERHPREACPEWPGWMTNNNAYCHKVRLHRTNKRTAPPTKLLIFLQHHQPPQPLPLLSQQQQLCALFMLSFCFHKDSTACNDRSCLVWEGVASLNCEWMNDEAVNDDWDRYVETNVLAAFVRTPS